MSTITLNEESWEALHTLLRAYTADRDAFHDACSDREGVVHDEQDADELARMDKMIDDARRALGLVSA